MTSRRFPPPWSVEEQDACFVVRDHDGQALAYIYFEDGAGAALLNRFWPRSYRARAIDHLLYDVNGGFWR